jgi:heme iron utilization protein
MEPTLAERARALVSLGRYGTLSTHSRKFEGFPFGSLMPYAPDRLGRPVLFVSAMAAHTQNLQADWRSSLLIVCPDFIGDSLEAARVTLLGSVEQVAAEEVRDLYLERHENARQWQDYGDFSFYRLYPTAVYFIGGFGVMGWIPCEEYEAAGPRA